MGISFEFRGNNKKAKGAPIELCSRRKGWADSRPQRPRGRWTRREAHRLGLEQGRDEALRQELRDRRAARGRRALPTSPKDYESRLVKMDFALPAKNRERILAEWTKRYNAKSEKQGASGTPELFPGARRSPQGFRRSPPCATSISASPRASSSAFLGPRAAARPRCCASSPASRSRAPAPSRMTGATFPACRPGQPRLRDRFPVLRAVPQSDRADNVAYGLANRGVPREPITKRVTQLLTLVGLPDQPAPRSEPAVGRPAAAHRHRARSPLSPGFCCSTSRCRRWMRGSVRLRQRDPRRCSSASASPPSW